MWPVQLSSWNNYIYGDCVSAEEAFAKATAAPQTFIPEATVVAWATAHGYLNGAYLTDVMTTMQTDGFPLNNQTYNDGSHFLVDHTNAATLQSAIYSHGPVKLGVGAEYFQSNANGIVTPGTSGWGMYNYPPNQPEDHSTSLCGYGTLAELVSLFGQQGVTVNVPNGMPTGLCYAMFTWNSIGIIDQQSMLNMTYEAWVRNPTTIVVGGPQPGSMQIFARGGDGAVWHNWQTAPNNGWSGWYSLGGWVDIIEVAKNADGRSECDEQREGDSCRTCRRLTIECLGWGPKRPEWMRDKQAVEVYKANIKAQLTRAGLIRGQPRTSLIHHHPSPVVPTQIRPQAYHRSSAPETTSSSPLHFDHPDYGYRYVNTPHEQHHRRDHNTIPGMPGASNPGFHQITDPSYTDTTLNALDLQTPFFPYPQSVTPISSSSSLSTDVGVDFSQLGAPQEQGSFDFDLRPPSPAPPVPFIIGQNNVQGDHVIYYFDHVRKIQLMFAGNTFTNATYSLIVQEPRGAVTNAVCALASLHFTRMRVAQGLEAPDPNPEHSNATYFHDEAWFQLDTAKQLHGTYTESEAIAALHLVCYSQLSGGTMGWQRAFVVMCEWLAQTGLLSDENPAITLHAMSTTAQVIFLQWLDTFSSLTLVKPPKYLRLLKRLLGERGGYWPAVGDSDGLHSLRMDLLTGCPDEAILALAEITNLAYWKATEQRNGTLSFRELVRRGDEIEQRLRQHHSNAAANLGEVDPAPLHPNLVQAANTEPRVAPFPSEEARRLVAKVFCEAAVLSLHTVLSNANPGTYLTTCIIVQQEL